jgi:hypothetical protein
LCESRGLRPGTIVSYRMSADLYVLPALRPVPIGQGTPTGFASRADPAPLRYNDREH